MTSTDLMLAKAAAGLSWVTVAASAVSGGPCDARVLVRSKRAIAQS